jgi:hypothetical protein
MHHVSFTVVQASRDSLSDDWRMNRHSFLVGYVDRAVVRAAVAKFYSKRRHLYRHINVLEFRVQGLGALF